MAGSNHSKVDWPTALIASLSSLQPAMVVATLGISLPEVRQALLLSEIKAGSLFSIIFIVAGVASAVAGRLSDRLGRKAVLVMGIGSLALGFALSGLAWNYAAMLLPLGLSGLGYGFTTPSLFALMSDLFPARRGLGAGLVSTFYGIGGLVGSLVASFVLRSSGWRAAFFTVGLIGAGITMLEMMAIKNVSSESTSTGPSSYRQEVNRNLVLLALAEFFGGSVFWSTASWTATVLRTVKELSLAETGLVMGLWGVTPMIGAILLGWLSDRFGRRAVILWSAFPGALAAFIVYRMLFSPTSLALGLVLFGTLKASVPTLVIALAQDFASVGSVGTASGVVMSLHYVSAVVAPLVAAQLIASTGDMILSMILTSSIPLMIYGSLIAAVREKSQN